jgi:isopentenyldiphosphate isomerase
MAHGRQSGVTAGSQAAHELVDVVDEHDVVVTTVTRAQMRAGRLRHRCVFIVVRRSDGRLLVHQRSADKDLLPSAWDVAVGGVVGSGEGWDEAAARELVEEVGIDGPPPRFRRTAHYQDALVDEVVRVYDVTWDGPIVFNDGEVVTAEWLDEPELAERRRHDAFCPDSLAVAGDLLF